MKRITALVILAALLLAACGTVTPTESDSQIATKVSQILTNMPTITRASVQVVTATAAPTQPAAPSATAAAEQGTMLPATSVPATATNPAATVLPPTPTTPPTATKAPTATTLPSATLPAGDPRASLGNPTWRDQMTNGNNWPLGVDSAGYTGIDFEDGLMLFSAYKPVDGWRLTIPSAVNFYLEMTVKADQCLADDRWGMIARVPNVSAANRGYLFGINCSGAFSLRKWDGTTLPKGSMTTLINWKTNPAVAAGAGKVNRLGFMARGSKISLYANGILLGDVLDASFTGEGYFGVFAGAHSSSSLTIAVDEMALWELP